MSCSLTATLRIMLASVAMAFSLVGCTIFQPLQPERIGYQADDLLENRISGESILRLAAGDIPDEDILDQQWLRIEVDPEGRVAGATDIGALYGITQPIDPAPAIALARTWRFRPFSWRGRPVRAVANVPIYRRHAELWGDERAVFPKIDSQDWSITLRRGNCLGTCPAYEVTVKGDGATVFSSPQWNFDGRQVTLRGMLGGVLVPGRHEGRIELSTAAALLKRFEEGQFFALSELYQSKITDQPTDILEFRYGNTVKTVVDYAGTLVGMPQIVNDLQEEVDRTAQTRRWIAGDETTAEALTTAGFDFTSEAAQALLAVASTSEAPDSLILALIGRDVPLDAMWILPGDDAPQHLGIWVTEVAAAFGRPSVLAKLDELGWLKRASQKNLERAFARGAGCDGEVARILVAQGVDPLTRNTDGDTALISLMGSQDCKKIGHDMARAVSTLLDVGVPVDATNTDGETALMHAEDDAIASLLLKAGANPNLRSNDGRKAILSSWDDRTVLTLLAAGADPSGFDNENRTLRQRAMSAACMPGTIAWLDQHGIQ